MASRPATVSTGARRGRNASKKSGANPSPKTQSEPVFLDSSAPSPQTPVPGKKRKHEVITISDDSEKDEEYLAAAANVASLNYDGDDLKPKASKTPKKKKTTGGEGEEKRLRVFRKGPPKTYLDRLDRVRTQRMFLIDRERKLSEDGSHQLEVFDIAGTTGNIYKVTISKQPLCTCPDAAKGNQCKHIIYVLVNVLKAPEHLAYQLALLSTELEEIFSQAPVTPQSSSGAASEDTSHPGKRKPIEGDCPICVMEFSEAEKADIVWCKAACGNNVHRGCFEQWAASKPGEVKCVYCRTEWKRDEGDVNLERIKNMSAGNRTNADGYVNVARELGISGRRDMSSYHQFWVRRQQREAWRGRGAFYNDDDYYEEDGW